jgi:hypothetical protein
MSSEAAACPAFFAGELGLGRLDFADCPPRHYSGGPPFKSALVIVRMASTVGG